MMGFMLIFLLCFGRSTYSPRSKERGLYLYIHFTHRNPIARFLLLHKLCGNFAHILLIQRGATEVGFDVSHRQNTPIVVVRLGGDIVFRYGGQHIQRNVGRMNTFGIDLELLLINCQLSLILIITISRATTKLDNVRIVEAAAEVFGVLLNDCFALNRFLGGEGSAFGKTYLSAILLGFSDALTDTAM